VADHGDEGVRLDTQVDTAEGVAWVGLVPLFMRNVRPRFTPAIPALSDFLELNLRTYVYDAMGRRLSSTKNNSVTESTTYTATGKVATRTELPESRDTATWTAWWATWASSRAAKTAIAASAAR